MNKETYTHIKREKENKSSLELLEIVMYGNEHQRAIGEVDQAYEDLKQALTELEELKEFISDIFADKELNQWLFDNRINMWVYIKNKRIYKKTTRS